MSVKMNFLRLVAGTTIVALASVAAGSTAARADDTNFGFNSGYDQLFNGTATTYNPFAQYYDLREQQYVVDGPMNVDVTQPMCIGGAWGAYVPLGVNTDTCLMPQVYVFGTTPDNPRLYLDESVMQWNGSQFVSMPASQQIALGRGWANCPGVGPGSDCDGWFTAFHSPTNTIWGWSPSGPAFEGLDDHVYLTSTTLWFYQGNATHYMQWRFLVRGAAWQLVGYAHT